MVLWHMWARNLEQISWWLFWCYDICGQGHGLLQWPHHEFEVSPIFLGFLGFYVDDKISIFSKVLCWNGSLIVCQVVVLILFQSDLISVFFIDSVELVWWLLLQAVSFFISSLFPMWWPIAAVLSSLSSSVANVLLLPIAMKGLVYRTFR